METMSRKSSLTSSENPRIERQARRVNRQQKQLDRQMIADMGQYGTTQLTGAKGRAVKLTDLKKLAPLTDIQHDFFDAYADGEEAMILFGSAGTGKTFLAMYHALTDILQPEPQYEKIIIVRSVVSSRDIGFLPGDIALKSAPYELPFQSIVTELTGKKEAYEKLKESGKIEFITTSFLRGLTFNKAIVIFDECQNATWGELSTLITRFGKDSKIIFCGDSVQNDLLQKKNDVSGLREFIEVTRSMTEFRHFKFSSDDIVRSGLVKSFIIQCEKLGIS